MCSFFGGHKSEGSRYSLYSFYNHYVIDPQSSLLDAESLGKINHLGCRHWRQKIFPLLWSSAPTELIASRTMAATEGLVAKTIVVDSGGIINAVALAGKAEVHAAVLVVKFRMHPLPGLQKYVTIPEVFEEIKDEQSRHRLQHLPYELEVRQPSDTALAAGSYPGLFRKFLALHVSHFGPQSQHMHGQQEI